MAECTGCGYQTELYVNGVAICVKCLEERDSKREPDEPYPGDLDSWRVPEDLKRSG
jgi:hypothetical protein